MDGLYQELAAAYARGMLPDAGTAAGVRRRTGPPQSPPPERRARQGDCPDARPVGAAHRMPRAGCEVARLLRADGSVKRLKPAVDWELQAVKQLEEIRGDRVRASPRDA